MLEQWRTWALIEKGLLPSTVNKYGGYLRDLERFAGSLPDLTTEQIRDWIHSRKGSNATVAGRLSASRSFYGFLVKTDKRLDDPTVKLERPKTRRGMPKPVNDLPTLLAQLSPQHQLIAIFLAETGLRISEAWDVDVDHPAPDALEVTGKGQKDRWVPLSEKAREALDALGGRMPGAKRTFQKAMQKAGATPHRLRHTFASELVEAGADLVDVQELLGHASPATTRIYTAVSKRRLRAALALRDSA